MSAANKSGKDTAATRRARAYPRSLLAARRATPALGGNGAAVAAGLALLLAACSGSPSGSGLDDGTHSHPEIEAALEAVIAGSGEHEHSSDAAVIEPSHDHHHDDTATDPSAASEAHTESSPPENAAATAPPDNAAATDPPEDAASAEAEAAPPSPADRTGEVHVHSDGLVHSHGAGAPEAWTVTYTSEGLFVPERIDILTGDTVVFFNASDDPVWPASNIHPTHEILPDFDPLGVIWPGESWSHTFDKNGYWRYHNHIEANQTGLVVSTGGPEQALEPLSLQAAAPEFAPAPPDVDGEALMDDEDALERFVLAHGPVAAVVALKAAELDTGRDCHDAAHTVGHVSWEHFGAAAFALVGHDCHAGALHGTLESLFAQRGTSRLADDVAAVCSSDNPFLTHQCLHGVGHGLLAWTTYELPEALALCDLLAHTVNRDSCYGGVYMENGVGGLSGLMGHTTEYISATDPHFPCNVLTERYWPGCYFWQTSNLFYFGWEADAVAAVCAEAAVNSRMACFASMGRDLGSIHRDDPAEAASKCRLAPTVEYLAQCVWGAALSRFTEPANAPFSAELCTIADAEDGAQVAEACWRMVLRDAPRIFNDADELRDFCEGIAAEHRRHACHAAARL